MGNRFPAMIMIEASALMEDAHSASPQYIGILTGMIKPAPTLAEIAAQFMRHQPESRVARHFCDL
jgi:hypothetical protein